MSSDQLVSIVIPAYNAEATIDDTLRSVRAQTHGALEIIVVDDGSTDTTLFLAKRHAADDPRVEVIHQPNAGVAAARNTGLQQARSDLLAFIDADDLWAPTKIERQLQALQGTALPRVGVVYTWTARIDSRGIVLGFNGGQLHEADVLSTILRGNFIGCGSNALFLRNALIDAEGFDTGLRTAGYEGCEDWLACSRIAETYNFVGVPEFLVGYRESTDSMSSNSQRMLGSHILSCRQTIARRPDLSRDIFVGLRNYTTWLMGVEVKKTNLGKAWSLWRILWKENRAVACQLIYYCLLKASLFPVCRHHRRRMVGPEPVLRLGLPFLFVPSDSL